MYMKVSSSYSVLWMTNELIVCHCGWLLSDKVYYIDENHSEILVFLMTLRMTTEPMEYDCGCQLSCMISARVTAKLMCYHCIHEISFGTEVSGVLVILPGFPQLLSNLVNETLWKIMEFQHCVMFHNDTVDQLEDE